MKLFSFILSVLILCSLVNDSSDSISNDKSIVNISISNNKGLLKLKSEYYNLITELCLNISVMVQIKDISNRLMKLNPIDIESSQENGLFNCIYYINTSDFRYAFTVRSITRIFNDSNHIVHNIFYSIIDSLAFILDLDNYYLRINWMYLGKYLTKNKYSLFTNVNTVKTPRSSILIIMLLFMCGDTGSSINPGPTCVTTTVDPDINHFTANIAFETHTIESFSNNIEFDNNNLKIIHNNARSLMSPGRMENYVGLLKNLKTAFDVLVFTETWLTPDNSDHCIFDGFQKPIHLLRPSNENPDFRLRGGGVSIFVRDNLNFRHRNDLTIMQPFMECSFIEIHFNNTKYLIGGIYRPPNTDINLFTEHFNSLIEPLNSSHKLILLGDYNVDLLTNNSTKNNFEICMQSNYLTPTILAPTRVALSMAQNGQEMISETLIDNIFINQNMKFMSGIVESSITDHYPIYIIIPEIKILNTQLTSIKFRLINDKNQRTFNCYLNHFKINDVLNDYLAKSAYTKFLNIFQNSYEKSFPLKTKIISQKDESHPWIKESHLNDMKERDKLCKLSKKKKIDKNIYTEFRNKLKERLRIAKSEYYKQQFEFHKNNAKKTWEVINKVIKSKRTRPKICLSDDEGNKYNDNEIPSKFIEYYTSIADKLTAEIPETQNDASTYLTNRIGHDFQMSPIYPAEVDNIIDELKSNGNNPNSIATSVLVNSKHILTPIICHLINLFVEQGYFPEHLKTGCITPIFKGGDREKIKNYRPVCSLSPLSKIIEKVVTNRMTHFLENSDIFSSTQFGFRKNMGTETALLNYIDYIQNQLNDYKYTLSIFMDLSKAFDVINHNILRTKLEHYGFRGHFLDFLLNFIKDREYFVYVNESNSDKKRVNIGVPQGSTLGPLLFLIYINDMIHCSKLFLTQFADDSTVTYSSKNLAEALLRVEFEFNRVLDWLAANKLIINLSKTHLMLFTNLSRPEYICISAKGQIINEVKETKFLGVILDNELKWNLHIEYISKKISKSVSILRMLKFTFPSNVLKNLYFSLIYPYYTYCNLVWGNAASIYLDSLIKLQKKSVRTISKAGYIDHTEPLFNNLKLLQVHEIYNFNCAKFIYQCHNNNSLKNFKSKLLTNSNYHDYNTRNKDSLRKPKGRLKQFTNSFMSRGIDIWNTLHYNIKNCTTIMSFKVHLKGYMMNNK